MYASAFDTNIYYLHVAVLRESRAQVLQRQLKAQLLTHLRWLNPLE